MASVAVFDASALIALFNTRDIHHDWALGAFKDSLDRNLKISTLTCAEVLPTSVPDSAEVALMFQIKRLGFDLEPLIESDAVELARLRSSTKLKMPDAVVLQVALKTEGLLVTADAKLAEVARTIGLEVRKP